MCYLERNRAGFYYGRRFNDRLSSHCFPIEMLAICLKNFRCSSIFRIYIRISCLKGFLSLCYNNDCLSATLCNIPRAFNSLKLGFVAATFLPTEPLHCWRPHHLWFNCISLSIYFPNRTYLHKKSQCFNSILNKTVWAFHCDNVKERK